MSERHAHRWRIASPDGREVLPGTCECGAERAFFAGYRLRKLGMWQKSTDRASSREAPLSPKGQKTQ